MESCCLVTVDVEKKEWLEATDFECEECLERFEGLQALVLSRVKLVRKRIVQKIIWKIKHCR